MLIPLATQLTPILAAYVIRQGRRLFSLDNRSPWAVKEASEQLGMDLITRRWSMPTWTPSW